MLRIVLRCTVLISVVRFGLGSVLVCIAQSRYVLFRAGVLWFLTDHWCSVLVQGASCCSVLFCALTCCFVVFLIVGWCSLLARLV